MPHLELDYAPALEAHVDMQALCRALCDELAVSGLFPPGALRVRARPAHFITLALGAEHGICLDMVLRMLPGRPEADRRALLAQLYETARRFVLAGTGDVPLALTLEIREIDPVNERSWNALHTLFTDRR
ncbi:MAG: 5-carboxymethyl-2-hydroxymuconate Delta-isomerase [Roseicyclus sp.]